MSDLGRFGQFSVRRYKADYPDASDFRMSSGPWLESLIAAIAAAYSFTELPGRDFAALILALYGFIGLMVALVSPHASGFGTPPREHPVTCWLYLIFGLVALPLGVWRIAAGL